MAPNPRANAALTTMKALGIVKEKVKPVLKRLLKLYDKNWELIEEDGYRALVDAIFEEEDEENTVEKKRKGSTDEEDDEEEAHTHELQRKKMRSRNPECLAGSPSTQPQMEGREGLKDKGKRPISPNAEIYLRDQGIRSRPSGIVFRENRYESQSCSVASPRDEPFGDEVPLNEPPIAMIPPDSSLMVESSLGHPSGEVNVNKSLVLYNAGCTNGVASSENGQYRKPYGPGIDGHRSRMPQLGALHGIHSSTVVKGASDNPKSHMRCFNDGDDISKGEESKKISWVNDIDKQHLPFFHYIPGSVIFEAASVNFTLSGIEEDSCCPNCSGDCLSSLPCACARANGGEFVYTVRGLVKEGFLQKCIANNRDAQKRHNYFCEECPLGRLKHDEVIEACKGHQRRRFIKECWTKCGCHKNCGNRLVQRGISCDLQVYMTSEGKNWGLRTLEELPKGAFVCEYVGEILTIKEWNKRKLQEDNGSKHTHGVLLDSEWGDLSVKDNGALCLDATLYGNIARFINHRCYDANLIEIPIEVESAKRHFYRVALFTTRKVLAMEELTWDYGIEFDDPDLNARPFKCLCGSKFCRQTKRPRLRAR